MSATRSSVAMLPLRMALKKNGAPGGGRRHFIEDAELRGVGPEQLVARVIVFLGLTLRRLRP